MMSLMQIQIMSSWQLSDYNSVIIDIETFHNLDTELLIKFGKWVGFQIKIGYLVLPFLFHIIFLFIVINYHNFMESMD